MDTERQYTPRACRNLRQHRQCQSFPITECLDLITKPLLFVAPDEPCALDLAWAPSSFAQTLGLKVITQERWRGTIAKVAASYDLSPSKSPIRRSILSLINAEC
jgi:hypothetical protein